MWLVYIFLASLGMLNILTGIIVDILKKPVPNERLLHLDAEAREAKQLSKMFAAELARLGRMRASFGNQTSLASAAAAALGLQPIGRAQGLLPSRGVGDPR